MHRRAYPWQWNEKLKIIYTLAVLIAQQKWIYFSEFVNKKNGKK